MPGFRTSCLWWQTTWVTILYWVGGFDVVLTITKRRLPRRWVFDVDLVSAAVLFILLVCRFHGGEIPTPNLDALAAESVQLKNYHVYHFCTPFRSALLTGRYPIRYGLQNEVIRPAEPNGLPLNETLLPEVLNAYGYRSHIVGKWHIGHYTWEHTPTYRTYLRLLRPFSPLFRSRRIRIPLRLLPV